MDTDLIKVVNRLQETFAAIGGAGDQVDLPQCVVLGSQSSGKSSVLECIVGRDFLPRGAGIVTRRPLVLQLVHTPRENPTSAMAQTTAGSSDGSPSNGSSPIEHGEFLHLDKRFTDFAEIRREIENETFRVAGQNKGISKLPIHLKIYSPNVLNLTLVDLPGLTKIPVGDQPSDIERQIQGLVTSYISKPNCIIIAVSPANVDLANSESLKLARAVDPQGRRTIGVLTKLDLMDNGTHALDILTGRVYPLKLGFIGVVNRSQQDINSNVSMLAARKAEEDFFRVHAAYRNIAHRCGTKYLAKTLNQVLMAHIRDKLPDMKARLNTLMGQTQQELAAFGDTSFMGEANRGTLVLKLMTQFARDFVASIDGTSFDISTKELCGGARVYYIFNDVFGQALDSINPTLNLTVQDIRTAIRNSTGPRPSLFVPEQAFELLIKPQIKLLEPPSLRCVELVYEELMKICHNCTSTELQRFPRLHAELIEVVSELLRERLGPTSEYVQSLIAIQAAYINTNHPSFVQDSANIARQTREGTAVRNPQLIKGPSASSGYDSDSNAGHMSEDEEDGPQRSSGQRGGANGSKHGRNDRAASTGNDGNSRGIDGSSYPSRQHAATIGHASGSGLRQAHDASANSNNRDGFLHYFFGGASMPPGGVGSGGGIGPGVGGSSTAGLGPVTPSLGTSTSQRGAFAEFGDPSARPGADRRPNLMAGRTGLEGSSAAYDMKSLDKHLEATPLSETAGLSERELLETNLIRSLIGSYFSIVRQMVADLVPKATMHLLVNFAKDEVSTTLVRKIFTQNADTYADLLEEDSNVRRERQRVEALLATYREAFNILSEVTFKP